MTDKPTDEALENLFVEETGFDIDDFPAAIFGFARAVLAKWGQPAQAAEPVAAVVPCYTPSGKRVALCSAKQDLPIGTKLYAAPQPSPTAQAAPAAGAVAGPDDYTPLLDDEGRMMVGTSHHYTAENIRALVAEYKALEAGGPDTWELHYNTDHRTRAGVLWRVISALADEVPFAAAAQAAESVPAVEREQERIAFKDAHRHLELYEVPDAWGRPMFKHSHVEASWLGWIAHASHGQASSQAGEYPALVCDYCGALTPDPWHSSGMLHGKMSKHIHSCDACAARGAAQAQDTREPLTRERVKEIARGAGYDQCGIPDTERAAFINGLRHGEREHGIKGGQHG